MIRVLAGEPFTQVGRCVADPDRAGTCTAMTSPAASSRRSRPRHPHRVVEPADRTRLVEHVDADSAVAQRSVAPSTPCSDADSSTTARTGNSTADVAPDRPSPAAHDAADLAAAELAAAKLAAADSDATWTSPGTPAAPGGTAAATTGAAVSPPSAAELTDQPARVPVHLAPDLADPAAPPAVVTRPGRATNRGRSRPGAGARPSARPGRAGTSDTTAPAAPECDTDDPAGPAPVHADGRACWTDLDGEVLDAERGLEDELEQLRAQRPALDDDDSIDDLTAQLSRKAKADGTRTSYERHFHSFRTWCEQRGALALPATTQTVLRHLTSIAVARDEHGQVRMRRNGRFERGLHVSTVQVRMYAIDYAHKQAGLPCPSKDPAVQTLMQGMRREFSVAPDEQRAPVDMADLPRLVSACHSPGVEMLVRQVALSLARAVGATPGQLTRLDWTDISIPATTGRATLSLTRTDVSRKRLKVVVRARPSAPDCPVAALVLLQAMTGGVGPVLRNVRGQRLAVQSVRRILGRTNAGQVEGPADATALRDRVLILVGWWSAVRRGNLTALRWSHLDFRLADLEGINMRLPFGKSDQEGRGDFKALLRVDEAPDLCPVRALQAWRAYLTQVLGRDPVTVPHLPVLLQVDRHGRVHLPAQLDADTVGLGGLAINRRIQLLADRCGLTAEAKQHGYGKVRHPYGGHSLRAGWLTAFVRAGGALHDGATQLGHAKLDTTKVYARSITALSASPSHLLLASLAQAQAAASRPRAAHPFGAQPRRRSGAGRPLGR